MKPDLILAIDQGTSGTKCLVVDASLHVCAEASVAVSSYGGVVPE